MIKIIQIFALVLTICLSTIVNANNVTNSSAPNNSIKSNFVGSKVCQSCHANEYNNWQKSDHYRSMNKADKDFVKGNFNNQQADFHNIKSKFTTENGKYFITTLNDKSEYQKYAVKYTFGHYPLQQYLLETENGKLQAYDIAWDSRPKTEGGQRWFSLQPNENITPKHPFFWTRHFQNWNSRCAECHSTDLNKNYNTETHSYNTTWAEVNIGCEACHGPASKHLEIANKFKKKNYSATDKAQIIKLSDFAINYSKPPLFVIKNNEKIATKQIDTPNNEQNNEINQCGSCHSRRQMLSNSSDKTSKNYYNDFNLQLLSEGLYYADGQISDEVFVLGSFLQSKMYQAGVTCSNCHNVHTGKVLALDNSLCEQCHNSSFYDNKNHHKHTIPKNTPLPNTTGTLCIDCHMPQTLYMGVDARRDHRFGSPNAKLTSDIKSPNACLNCHKNKDLNWLKQQLPFNKNIAPNNNSNLGNSDNLDKIVKWAESNNQARQANIANIDDIAAAINDKTLPAIIRASILEQVEQIPFAKTTKIIEANLKDNSPLVRQAAIKSSSYLDDETRYKLIQPLLTDDVKSVRFEAVKQILTPLYAKDASNKTIAEYLDSLNLHADTVQGQMAYADYYLKTNQVDLALQHLKQTLKLEEYYVPALLNIADVYRALGDEKQAQSYLQIALKTAPDSAGVQHSYGLSLIRAGKINEAMPALKLAIELPDTNARYYYIYAVALESQNQLDAAIATLNDANKRFPNNPDLLQLTAQYLLKQGQPQQAMIYQQQLDNLLKLNNN